MEIPRTVVETILREVVKRAQKTFDRFGLYQLPKAINEVLPPDYKPIGPRYIYDSIYLSLERAKKLDEATVRLDQSCLDSMAYFIGFQNIESFKLAQLPAHSSKNSVLEGTWYSCVRSNSGLPNVLISPVEIRAVEDHKTILKLKGPHRVYQGEIRWTGSSMSCLAVSEDKTKTLHLAFKVGVSKHPKLLIGVFSGVSSAGDPIAGKEILYKSDLDFIQMKNFKVPIAAPENLMPYGIPGSIVTFFSDFDKNYFKISGISTFDLNDIELVTPN